MKLRRPSPALVVSIIALVVASAGTATAATLIGSKQVRNNSLTTSDIKNKSLRGVDMRSGTITPTQLSKGTLQRIDKKTGTVTTSTATGFEAIRKNGPSAQPANVGGNAARLSLQPGAYVITAKTVLAGFLEGNSLQNLLSSTESAAGACKLDVGGDADVAVGNVIAGNRPATTTLAMQLTRTLGGVTDAVVTCSSSVPVNVTNTTIIATKVATVARTESTG